MAADCLFSFLSSSEQTGKAQTGQPVGQTCQRRTGNQFIVYFFLFFFFFFFGCCALLEFQAPDPGWQQTVRPLPGLQVADRHPIFNSSFICFSFFFLRCSTFKCLMTRAHMCVHYQAKRMFLQNTGLIFAKSRLTCPGDGLIILFHFFLFFLGFIFQRTDDHLNVAADRLVIHQTDCQAADWSALAMDLFFFF